MAFLLFLSGGAEKSSCSTFTVSDDAGFCEAVSAGSDLDETEAFEADTKLRFPSTEEAGKGAPSFDALVGRILCSSAL